MATAKKTDTKVVPFPGDPEVTAERSRALGLSEAELTRAQKELGRNLTHAELGVLAQMWSEDESQKLARVHTRRLPTTAPHVLRGLSDAAGAIDLGDGFCAVVGLGRVPARGSVASASLGAGDALRDVIALGARPLALLDSVRLGAADERETADALRSLVASLGDYARHAGVPVVGGDLKFERRYAAEPLVQLFALGVVSTEAAVESRATGLGNTVVYAGTAPGSDASADPREAVSADALALKRLTDACLSAFRLGSVEGAHAVGNSGVAGAALRLAESGSTGIELDLDAIPRSAGASSANPHELLCGAGGERMLLVVRKGREDSVLDLFRDHQLEAKVIGRVTNTERLVCKATADDKPVVVFDLPVALLTRDAPTYERPAKATPADTSAPELKLRRNEDAESELVRLLGAANVGSREWLIRRLEASKSGGTKLPIGDAAVLRVTTSDADDALEKHVAVAVDGSARYLELDPREGAAMAVAECARNLVCVGAEPLGLAHALTLGNSDRPEAMYRLSGAVDGIRDACLALKLPVIGSSVTLSQQDVPNTPITAVIGQLRDPADRLGIGFVRQADTVALLGVAGTGNLAGSEILAGRDPEARGKPLTLDLAAEVKLQRAVLELARERLLSSAHDVSEGGVGVTLAECCIAGRIGCSVELPAVEGLDALHVLFHEEPSRIVISFPPEQRAKVQERCTNLGVPFHFLGFVGGDTLEIEDVLEVPVQVLDESYSRALEPLVGD